MASALIHQSQAPHLIGNVQHWEETGARLECAIAAYLHSSLALEQSTSTAFHIGADNLLTRLDRRIHYFHTLMTQPLAQSLASVARTRNKLLTPIYRIPPEIQGRIFELAVHGSGKGLPMKPAIVETCRCLYRILSVCSVWRKVAIAHTTLWTLVPLVLLHGTGCVTMKSVKFGFERSGRADLHLVVDSGNASIIGLRSLFVEHWSRFRVANLRSATPYLLEGVLDPILESASPGSVAELSLCLESGNEPDHARSRQIFLDNPPSKQAVFESVLKTLQVLRLNNVIPRFGDASFENLVELRVQEVAFGTDATLRMFLGTLATASRLETFDMISSRAHSHDHDVGLHPPFILDLPLSLPHLKTLYLDDLTSNVIDTVLSSIKPGPHRTVLSASNVITMLQLEDGQVEADIRALQLAFQHHNIDTLILTEL